MSNSKLPIPLALVGALILFAIFAVAVWISVGPSGVDTVKLPFALPVIGDTTNEITILALLTGPIIGAIVVTGFVLRVLFGGLDKTVNSVKEDDGWKASVADATKREKAIVKEFVKSQPPDPVPSHERAGTASISTALVVGLLMAFVGAAFSANFLDEANQGMYAAVFAVIGAVASLIGLNATQVKKTESEAGSPLSGGAIWVVLTGFIVMGLGVGVMMWVRSQGG